MMAMKKGLLFTIKTLYLNKNTKFVISFLNTGKSFSEALILASTITHNMTKDFHGITMKTTSEEHGKNMFCPCKKSF